MSELDALFADLKKVDGGAPTKKPKHTAPESIPDALVLCMVRLNCKCGSEHETPNRILLLRYGKTLTVIKKWVDRYNSLPREIVIRKEKIAACELCFDTSFFSLLDYRTPAGEVEKK